VKSIAPRTRKAITTIAKRAVSRSIETKFSSNGSTGTSGPFQIYGDTIPTGGPVQIYPAMMEIVEGQTANQRSGVKINPVKHTTDLIFTFNPRSLNNSGGNTADECAWDITVHIWYGYVRKYKKQDDIALNATDIVNAMLDINSAGTTRWSGLITDEFYNVNKEFGTFKHKKVRMYKDAGQANSLDFSVPGQATPLKDATRVHLKWNPPKTLQYETDLGTLPENYAPVVIVGYGHNDFSQASNSFAPTTPMTALNTPAIQMFKLDKLWFKDG